jgi:hypothetical protein
MSIATDFDIAQQIIDGLNRLDGKPLSALMARGLAVQLKGYAEWAEQKSTGQVKEWLRCECTDEVVGKASAFYEEYRDALREEVNDYVLRFCDEEAAEAFHDGDFDDAITDCVDEAAGRAYFNYC